MPQVTERKNLFGRGLRGLINPYNADSEVSASDYGEGAPPLPDGGERAVVELINQRYRDAASARSHLEREWLVNIAYELDNQWVKWDRYGSLVSDKDPKDPYRSYEQYNRIAPITAKLIARWTQSRPDASVKPRTASQMDDAAADEARAWLAYCDEKFSDHIDSLEAAHWAITCNAPAVKLCWDPDAEASVPAAYAPDGSIAQTQMAKVGDIDREVVPPLNLYRDPKARHRGDARWMIDARLRSTNEVQEKYPETSAKLRGGQIDQAFAGMIANYLAAVTGDFGQQMSSDARKNQVLVLECWEKPTPRYPKGRLIVVAENQLLRYEDWPYDKKDDFPYVFLPYRGMLGSVYSMPVVTGLVPMQANYNKIWSRIHDRINSDFPSLLVPKGSEIGVDAYTSPRNYRLIYHTPGMVPQYQTAPPFNAQWFAVLDRIEANMMHYSGVHEVSDGRVPSGVSAAAAIELLQQSDTTQMAEPIGHIEQFHRQMATWAIALAAQYCREDRLMYVADTDDPERQRLQAMSFKALNAGGQVRVVITPGSATPKSPSARQAQIDAWYGMQALGIPGSPEAIKTYFDLLGEAKSDEIVDRAAQSIANAQQAAQQAAEQQAQMQAELQAQQAQQQAALQAQQAAMQPGEAQGPDPLQVESLKQQGAMEQAQMQHDAELQRVGLQAQTDTRQMLLQHALEMEKNRQQAGLDIAKIKATPKPPARPAGKR